MSRETLDRLYSRYNSRRFADLDPVKFLYRYEDVADREIAGLVASSLAYGRIAQILRSVSHILELMGTPSGFLGRASVESLRHAFRGFKHRFADGNDLAAMLVGAGRVIERYGSLGGCFSAHLDDRCDTILPALSGFVEELRREANGCTSHLLPSPANGSACKRLNLFLRWMVRRDEVDPGGWDDVPASKLIVPLDVHMHRISLALGLTGSKQANMRTALEITGAFRKIRPEDPVRYDFALTRLGILEIADADSLLCSEDMRASNGSQTG